MSKPLQWVLGYHAVSAVLSAQPQRAVRLLYVSSPHREDQASLVNSALSLGINTQVVDKKSLSKQVGSEQHQGVALHAKPRKEGDEKDLAVFLSELIVTKQRKNVFMLILDQVQDPHNFGACLRTADAAGVDAVIVAKDNSSPITPVVQKVASGAADTIKLFRVTNLARTMQAIQQRGVWILGTSDKAEESLYKQTLSGHIAIVMGAEGKGMRHLTEKTCDQLVRLPMAGNIVTSLNVSVATGVCLFEVVRQRVAQQ